MVCSGQRAALLLTTVFAVAACGGRGRRVYAPDRQGVEDSHDAGGRVAPVSGEDQQLLERLGEMPSEGSVQIGAHEYQVGAPYHAANGRQCRSVVGQGDDSKATRRLSCSEGNGWFFVPDVFGRE